jgi:tetratricopeptide (TPR) repeat protein
MLVAMGAPCGMEQASGWNVLCHASAFILNDQEWLSVPRSGEPWFRACVSVQGLTHEDLFSRCRKVLQPLLDATPSDVYAADGKYSIEGMFDAREFFDCLSHLAVFASPVLGTICHSSVAAVELLDAEQAGLSATVTSHVLTGRDAEARVVDNCIRPVFTLGDSSSHCKLVLIHGIPGTGKSSLADSALSRLDTDYMASDSIGGAGQVVEEYSCKIQARRSDSVRDGLHKMGLSLCHQLGIGSAASIEDVLGSDLKPPRLRQFLQAQRFVILADDADEDGFKELLLHVPRSSKPCALIVTSQFGASLISQIIQSDRKYDIIAVELFCFKPEVSLKLVEAICQSSRYAESRVELHSWLTQVLEQLGHLPLVVRVFAEWLHQELMQPLPEGAAVNLAGLQERWRHEYDKGDGEDAGVLNASVIGSRGLRATVRLALHNLKAHGDCEACRQLLGLLALCPPVQVPWSLFDGCSSVSPVGESCMVDIGSSVVPAVIAYDEVVYERTVQSIRVKLLGQKKSKVVARSSVKFGPHVLGMMNDTKRYFLQINTAEMYIRGARVHVNGESIDVVSPVNFHCNIRGRLGKGIILAASGSTLTIEVNGKRESIDFSYIETEEGDLELMNGHCMLRLRSFHSIVGSECHLSNGSRGVIQNVVADGAFGLNHIVHFKPHSRIFAPIWIAFLLRSIRACERDLWISVCAIVISAALSWFGISFDQRLLMFVSGNDLISDFMSKCGSVVGLEKNDFAFYAAMLSCIAICKCFKQFVWHSAVLGCISRVLGLEFGFLTFILVTSFFVLLKITQNIGEISKMTHQVPWSDLRWSEPVVIHNGTLCFKKCLGTKHYSCDGRVVQRHDDGTVSVAFGCETGERSPPAAAAPALALCDSFFFRAGPLSAVKPGAEVKRFKAGNVCVRGVEGVAPAVVEAEGLKRVAAVLRRSGLVQVDEGRRMFGLHQLLQQAVGIQLGWRGQCQRMRQLLHARCGRFGDETLFDVSLYGVMREVTAAAVDAVGRVKEKGEETGDSWCSGMLLRLYEVAREVYGLDAEFSLRVLAAAHGSLVADLVGERVMEEGCTSAGRHMTLLQLVHTAPHLCDVIALHPAFREDKDGLIRLASEALSKGMEPPSISDMRKLLRVQAFDLKKCLETQWKRATRASLLAWIVRAHVMEESGAALPLQEVAAMPLVRDVAGTGDERVLEQLLQGAAGGLKLVWEDRRGGGWRVEAAGEAGVGWRNDWRALKAMRWRLHTFTGDVEYFERMMSEIGEDDAADVEGGVKWELGVALGAACEAAGQWYSSNGPETQEKEKAAYERALRMRLDTLGEQHPATACTLGSLGVTYSQMEDIGSAIMLYERALRIFKNTLGSHPATALTMSGIGVQYGKKKRDMEAMKLFEQALRIYESTVGRTHRDAADAIFNMSVSYYTLGDFAKAEELALEAEKIYKETLSKDHEESKKAQKNLAAIRHNAKSLGRGLKK